MHELINDFKMSLNAILPQKSFSSASSSIYRKLIGLLFLLSFFSLFQYREAPRAEKFHFIKVLYYGEIKILRTRADMR